MSSENYDGDMTAYIVDGEILNAVFGGVSVPIGDARKIGKKSDARKIIEWMVPHNTVLEIIVSIYRHTMSKVIKELSKEEKNAKKH